MTIVSDAIARVSTSAAELFLRKKGFIRSNEVFPTDYVSLREHGRTETETTIFLNGQPVYELSSHVYTDQINDHIRFVGNDQAEYRAMHTSYGEHRLTVKYPDGTEKSHFIFPHNAEAAPVFNNPELFRGYQVQHELFLTKMRALPMVVEPILSEFEGDANLVLEKYGQFLVRHQKMRGLVVIGKREYVPETPTALYKISTKNDPVLGSGK